MQKKHSAGRTVEPIAYIRNDFKEKFGIPRQSGRVEALISRIVLEKPYGVRDAFREIEGFSHLWLIFDFSLVSDGDFSPTVRPPRLGGNRRVGVFASRSPFRPNRLGLSSVRLLSVEESGGGIELVVAGADLLDGTPIYDIKPYLPFSDSHPDAVGGYADGEREHRLSVVFDEHILAPLAQDKRQALIACLADDPRPSYQDDPSRVYRMRFAEFDVGFTVAGDTLTVMDLVQVGNGRSE